LFADRYERLMWEAGFPVEFCTREKAEAVIAELRTRPEFRHLTMTVED
jgi:hypothetical protein